MSNDLSLLRETVTRLSHAGFRTAVFGGWAEELHGLCPPREHRDIDLVVVDADVGELDAFVRGCGEVDAKRQTHKRAFVTESVLVELFIVSTVDDEPVTNFWDSFRYRWPDLGPVEIDGLPVVAVAALAAYRADHGRISAHRR